MTNWFVRAELDAAATDAEAEEFAQRIGSTFVDRSRGRTGISWYMTAASLEEAASAGLKQLSAEVTAIGLDSKVIQFEVKPEEDRVAELMKQGIPMTTGIAAIQK